MFKKDLIVHVIRIGQPAYIVRPRSLIDVVCNDDGSIKFPFDAFNCHPSKCRVDAAVDRRDADLMTAESGEFTVVETPAGQALVIISLILSVASAIYAYTQTPNIPTSQDLGSSSNNSLSSRTNRERPLKRIEDIAGEVNSVPSLIQLPYRKWRDKQEVEYSYMCVSVGSGVPIDARDGDTPINIMSGSGAQFYAPNTSPNNSAPEYVFGESFTEPVNIIRRSNEVAGGENLKSVSDYTLDINGGGGGTGTALVYEASGIEAGRIRRRTGDYSFEEFFSSGDTIQLIGGFNDDEGEYVSLDGTYLVQSSSSSEILLISESGGGAEEVNENWAVIDGNDISGQLKLINGDASELSFSGPFFLNGNLSGFYVNLVANGLISDNGDGIGVDCELQYAQADSDGNMIGAWSSSIFDRLSGQTRDKIGLTIEADLPFTGNALVRIKRSTTRIPNAQLQDVTIDALYSIEAIENDDLGNVTTVQTRVLQSQRASQVKERKFNTNWQRKLPIVVDDGTLGAETTTKRFVDYFVYAALSDKIGRREQWEVDNQDIAEKYGDIVSYFDDSRAAEFSYTFDSDQTSFQETCEIISKAVFCQSIRRRGVITVKFERPSIPSTIFCHRTKIPNQQTITRSFKSDSINDGIEFTYIDPTTNEQAVIALPEVGAVTPRKIDSLGVRNKEQANWLAYRAWNKLRYQRLTLNDTFTTEGQLLSVIDIVGVTDDTKAKPENGEVVFVDGLVITLSQPVTFIDGESHSITLRKRDGSIQGISCSNPTASSTTISVLLASSPDEAIYTGYAEERTRFTFSADNRASADYYIVTDVDRSDPDAVAVTAINYDERYYQNDRDVINWVDGDLWVDGEQWID